MREIFIKKGIESAIMDRLMGLREMVGMYKYGSPHRIVLDNYRTALQAYEVTDKEVVAWKDKIKNGRLHRRKNKAVNHQLESKTSIKKIHQER